MSKLIGGPHDGDHYPAGSDVWIGVVLPLTPAKEFVQPGKPGALYQWHGRDWLFTGFVRRGYDHDSFMFAPEYGRRPQPRGWLAKLADAARAVCGIREDRNDAA